MRKKPEISDAAAVAALESSWERLWSAHHGDLDQEFASLMERWQPQSKLDPISIEVDLLSPIGNETYEPAHTQVLAYLLDPSGGHGLKDAALLRFLDVVKGSMDDEKRASAFLAAGSDWTEAVVVAERAALLTSEAGENRPKTDLWIELADDAVRVLLVVENKIDSKTRPGQLAAYERAIELRLAQLQSSPHVVKVLLTPWGEAAPAESGGTDWVCLSYGDLGMAWMTLLDGVDSPGASFVRLYLATVFQRVLGLSYRGHVSRAQRSYLAEYLRARLVVFDAD